MGIPNHTMLTFCLPRAVPCSSGAHCVRTPMRLTATTTSAAATMIRRVRTMLLVEHGQGNLARESGTGIKLTHYPQFSQSDNCGVGASVIARLARTPADSESACLPERCFLAAENYAPMYAAGPPAVDRTAVPSGNTMEYPMECG